MVICALLMSKCDMRITCRLLRFDRSDASPSPIDFHIGIYREEGHQLSLVLLFCVYGYT